MVPRPDFVTSHRILLAIAIVVLRSNTPARRSQYLNVSNAPVTVYAFPLSLYNTI